MCVLISFRVWGGLKTAVMAGGFCCFMLVTTAKRMAAWTAGPQVRRAPRAFIVVPVSAPS